MSGPYIGFAVSFVVALVGTRVIELWARRSSIYDRFTERSAHVHPTPRLGGGAILLATVVGSILGSAGLEGHALLLLGGATSLFAVGLIDDLRPMSVLPRALAQALVAALTALTLQPAIEIQLPFASFHVDGMGAVLLASVWLVAVMNVFNFMDGIDGMVGGVTAITVPAAIALAGGAATTPILIALAAACLGFLMWNHPPASIFMGDGGSVVIGYLIAAVWVAAEARPAPALAAAIALAPFLLDATATLVRRVRAGADLTAAHNDHLYQRLLKRGYSNRVTCGVYVVASTCAGMAAVLYAVSGDLARASILGVLALAVAGYIAAVRWTSDERPPAGPVGAASD